MMRCDGGPAEELAEQYLMGGLTEKEREHFEEHYFSCAACHEYLLRLKEIQSELGRDAGSQAAARPMRIVARGSMAKAVPFRLVAFGALAAMILMAVVLTELAGRQGGRHREAAQTPANSLPVDGTSVANAKKETGAAHDDAHSRQVEMAALADLALPGYHAPQLRGAETSDAQHAAFAAGMERYVAGDCTGAIEELNQVHDDAANGVAANLYAGLCQFKRKRLAEAQTSLEKVVAAGDTPQLEAADYYMAQTMLLRSDAAGGSRWLSKTIALHGDYEERARAELSRLPQGPGAR